MIAVMGLTDRTIATNCFLLWHLETQKRPLYDCCNGFNRSHTSNNFFFSSGIQTHGIDPYMIAVMDLTDRTIATNCFLLWHLETWKRPLYDCCNGFNRSHTSNNFFFSSGIQTHGIDPYMIAVMDLTDRTIATNCFLLWHLETWKRPLYDCCNGFNRSHTSNKFFFSSGIQRHGNDPYMIAVMDLTDRTIATKFFSPLAFKDMETTLI